MNRDLELDLMSKSKLFFQLTADVQKKTELIAQYDSAASNKSSINFWLDEQQDLTPEPRPVTQVSERLRALFLARPRNDSVGQRRRTVTKEHALGTDCQATGPRLEAKIAKRPCTHTMDLKASQSHEMQMHENSSFTFTIAKLNFHFSCPTHPTKCRPLQEVSRHLRFFPTTWARPKLRGPPPHQKMSTMSMHTTVVLSLFARSRGE
mgnify:CR=1 FL=1